MVKETIFQIFRKHLLLHFSPFFSLQLVSTYSATVIRIFKIKSLLVLKIIQNSELYMKVFLKFLFHF